MLKCPVRRQWVLQGVTIHCKSVLVQMDAEYVPNLTDRKKWNQATPSLRIGNRVLIMDENTRRG
jgi:hypothetical protein